MKTFSNIRHLLLLVLLLVCGVNMAMAVDIDNSFTVPCADYKPNGKQFVATLTGFSASSTIEVKIDLSGCGSTEENVLSLGQNTSKWNGKALHFYYTKSNKTLVINLVDDKLSDTGIQNWRKKTLNNVEASVVTVKLSGGKLYVGDEEMESFINSKNASCNLSDCFTTCGYFSMGDIQVGSNSETSKLSHATYTIGIDGCKLKESETTPEDKVLQLPVSSFSPNGGKFVATTEFNKDENSIYAEIDLTGCVGKTNENILSIGTNIDVWGNSSEKESERAYDIHLYYPYKGDNSQVQVNYTYRTNQVQATYPIGSARTLKVELSKDGLSLNGATFFNADAISALLSQTALQIGSRQGDNRSHATYASIKMLYDDIQLALPLASDFTPDHDRHFSGKLYDVNKYSVIKSTIDLSSCLQVTTNENVISFGNDISQWNKAGVYNLHFYYEKSSKKLIADWVNQDSKYAGQATASTNSNNGAFEWWTTFEAHPTTLDIEISYDGGLKVNGVTADDASGWLKSQIQQYLYSKSPLTVGSKQGSPSHATYKTILAEQTTQATLPTTLPAEWFKADLASDCKFNMNADLSTGRSLIAELDLTNCKKANENVLSIGTDIGVWSAVDVYNLHFYYTASTKQLKYSWTEKTPNYKEISGTVYISNTSHVILRISPDNGLEINGEHPKGLNTELNDRIKAGLYDNAAANTQIQVGSREGTTRSNAIYRSIRLGMVNDDGTAEPGIKHFANLAAFKAGYNMSDFGKFVIDEVPVDFYTQKITANIDLTSCGEDSEENINILSVGNSIDWWGEDMSGIYNLHLYYVPRTKKLIVDMVDKNGYIGSGETKVERSYDVAATSLKVNLSAHGIEIEGLENNQNKYALPQNFFTARMYMNMLRNSNVQVGSAQGIYSTATYTSIAVDDLTSDKKIEKIDLPQTNYTPGTNDGYTDTKYFVADLGNMSFIDKKIVARLNLSQCKNAAENVLSIGTAINVWKSDLTYNLHFYYNPTDRQLDVQWFNARKATSNDVPTTQATISLTETQANDCRIELSANGLSVNGTMLEGFNAIDMFELMMRSKNLQLGSLEGDVRSNASYNELDVVDDPDHNFSLLYIISPEMVGDNKETAHATYIPYPSTAKMEDDKDFYNKPWTKPNEEDAMVRSLNGNDWRFKYVAGTASGPGASDFFAKDFNDSQWSAITVPMSWEMVGHGRPVYTNIGYPFQDTPPVAMASNAATQEGDNNATGFYRRTFSVPADWQDKRIFVHFDGVYSAAVVWVNGNYVGYSQGANTDAEFDITKYAEVGNDNQLSVRVYRWCDGSYFEGQDMWHLSGIHRDVYLKATPKVFASNHKITANGLATDATSAHSLDVTLTIDNRDGAQASKTYDVVLKDASGSKLASTTVAYDAAATADVVAKLDLSGKTLQPWSAETPYLYTIEVSQKGDDGEEMAFSTKYGFRKVYTEGGVLYVNGKRIYVKGVNSHDTNPLTGKALSMDDMLGDIKMMKRANINTFRGSHYPRQPKMYAMFDYYGMYVIPSADVECHGHQSLSSDADWLLTMEDRTERMVRRDINHPSVIIWSLGNECGKGTNFAETYKLCKELDGSRPIHYEGDDNNSDFHSVMYPTVATVSKWNTSSSDHKKPYIMCEYAHAMGQGVGNLQDYWDAIEADKYVAGGCIWDWADQALYDVARINNGNALTDDNGFHYWMSGYDYNKIQKNIGFEGNFLDNGLVTPDRKWTGKLAEVKKVYQNVDFESYSGGVLKLKNKYDFTNLDAFNLVYRVLRNGRIVEEKTMAMPSVEAGTEGSVDVAYATEFEGTDEYVIDFELTLKEPTPWAESNYDVAREQFVLNPSSADDNLPFLTEHKAKGGSIGFADGKVSGSDADSKAFSIEFASDGKMTSWKYDGHDIIAAGPDFNSMRNIDNDVNLNIAQVASSTTTITKALAEDANGNLTMQTSGSATACTYTIDYTFYPDAMVDMKVTFTPTADTRRIGLGLQFAKGFEGVEYYGRGPWSNYVDRKTGTYLGRYLTTVDDMVEEQIHPQTYGDHQDLRELTLTNPLNDLSLTVQAEGLVAFSLSHYDESQWCGTSGTSKKTLWNDPKHWQDLTRYSQLFAHFDYWQRGLGNNSCQGDTSLTQYQCPVSGNHSYTLRMTPKH